MVDIAWCRDMPEEAASHIEYQSKRIEELEAELAKWKEYNRQAAKDMAHMINFKNEQAQCIKEMREALREYANSAQAYGRIARDVLARWPE